MKDILNDPQVAAAIVSLIGLAVAWTARTIRSTIADHVRDARWKDLETLRAYILAAVDEVERETARPRREAGAVAGDSAVPKPITAAEKAEWNRRAAERVTEMAAADGFNLRKVLGAAAREILPGLISASVKALKNGAGLGALLG